MWTTWRMRFPSWLQCRRLCLWADVRRHWICWLRRWPEPRLVVGPTISGAPRARWTCPPARPSRRSRRPKVWRALRQSSRTAPSTRPRTAPNRRRRRRQSCGRQHLRRRAACKRPVAFGRRTRTRTTGRRRSAAAMGQAADSRAAGLRPRVHL